MKQLVPMGSSECLRWKMLQAKVSSMDCLLALCAFLFLILIFCVISFSRFLRINLPVGGHPVGVTFTDDSSSVVVASQALAGTGSLYMYAEEKPNNSDGNKQQTKLPLPEMKWQHHKVHGKQGILNMFGTTATYGSADGSTIIASCSEGIANTYAVQTTCS